MLPFFYFSHLSLIPIFAEQPILIEDAGFEMN
jgi:hypothetical protein